MKARAALLLVPFAVAVACGGRSEKPATAKPEPTPVAEWSATPLPYPTPTSFVSKFIKDVNREISTAGDGLRLPVLEAIDGISEEDERALGQATAVEVIRESGGLLLDDALLVRYVNRVANSVAQRGARKRLRRDGTPRTQTRDFVVGVLDDDATINAFSTPGGYVFLTSGLLRDLGSESELAWVLGHEIAHVDLEHGLEALKIYVGQQALTASLTGRDHTMRWSDPGFFGRMAGTMAAISDRIHGKKEERQSDLLGLEYAVAAGYDADGAARVLDMLADRTARRASPIATHEPPAVRRAALESAIAEVKAKPGYTGRVGASRFTRECIDRLDGVRTASR